MMRNKKFTIMLFVMLVGILALFCVSINKSVTNKFTTNSKTYADSSCSTRLTSLSIAEYEDELEPVFESSVTNYSILFLETQIDANVEYETEDPNSTVTVTGNKYMKSNFGTITVQVTNPSCSSTTYTINYMKNKEFVKVSQNFAYTGQYQVFKAPSSSLFKIELWGAQGGTRADWLPGGYGGYTSGVIKIKRNEELYVYVGAQASGDASNTLGGWNGGGNCPNGKDADARCGGGATDVRLVKTSSLTTWNEFNSLKSRIMVAAGGGGATYESGSWYATGGSAGGLTGRTAVTYTSNSGGYYGAGGTQISAGNSISQGPYGYSPGGFGYGGNSKSTDGGAGGGGGYYGGGGASYCSAGGGGSSFISGHDGCNAIKETSTSGAIVHTNESIHYSGKSFAETIMIDGAGHKWTTKDDGLELMPNPAGGFFASGTGNLGNGYARITSLEPANTNNYLVSLTASSGTFDKIFDPLVNSYTLTTDVFTKQVELYPVLDDEEKASYEIDIPDYLNIGANNASITVTADDGSIRVYTIKIVRKALTTEHSCELDTISIDGYDNIYPVKGEYNFNLELKYGTLEVDVSVIPYDSEATYTVTGNNMMFGNEGSIKIVVNEPHKSPLTYTINYHKEVALSAVQKVYNYPYTGEYQTFITPVTGDYTVELWGAQGGNREENTLMGGYGGYTKGTIHLAKGTPLYIYVGGQAKNEASNTVGGWNGGGNSPNGKDPDGRPGGGATDIRLVNTSALNVWNEFNSLKSRIMVAAGGGGAAYENSASWRSNGGNAGGLLGYSPSSMGGSAASNYGTGAKQNSGGYYVNDINNATAKGTFGVGGNGISTDGGSGGGGGYYGGGGSNVCSGAGGGSSYISGHKGSNSITEDSTSSSIKFTEEEFHYSEMVFTDTLLIDGSGYKWINVKDTLEPMPKPDGEFYNSGTGHKGHGYAIITPNDLESKNNYIESLEYSAGTLTPAFSPINYSYTLTVEKAVNFVELVPHLYDDFATYQISGLDGDLEIGSNPVTISVTAPSGDIKVYEIDVVRRGLNPGEHSSELYKVDISDLETIYIEPGVFEYTINISYAIVSLPVKTYAYDEEAIVKLSGFGYVKKSGTGTITVTEPNSSPTVYKFNIIKEGAPAQTEFEYMYTGDYQVFEAPITGWYKFEAWGAQGGSTWASMHGGYGGYTSGQIKLQKGEILFIYVGGKGSDEPYNLKGGWNGGGGTPVNKDSDSRAGGGASDIRTESGDWNDFDSLKSRIMVAAGGGGGTYESGSWHGLGGSGGGLDGLKSPYMSGNSNNYRSTPATQTSPGQSTVQHGSAAKSIGGFGYGGTGTHTDGGAGGGGGYYGGGGTAYCSPGAGGSSFISGHEGANAISESSTKTNIIHTNQSKHYSGYVFKNTEMIDGEGISWTDVRDVETPMPTPAGGYYASGVGHSGDGFVKISILDLSQNNFLNTLTVRDDDDNFMDYKDIDGNSFDMTVNEYYLNLESDITLLNVTGRLEDSKATVEGFGKYDIPAGDTDIEVNVTAENGDIRTYTIHVHRPASDNPYPENIEINGLVPSLCSVGDSYCEINPAVFNKDTTTYYVTVPSRIKQIATIVTEGHAYQTVTGAGKISLAGGENTVTIDIVSEDGSRTSQYIYVITRDMTGDNYIDNLEIIDPERDINFEPDILSYYIVVPNEYTSIKEMNIELDDPENASYIVSGNSDFETGMNTVIITVTAGNGEIRMYTINVYREKNANALLKELYVEDLHGIRYDVAPVFNEINFGTYYVTVPNSVSEAKIMAIPDASTSTVTGAGNKTLSTSDNSFVLTVTAQNVEVTEQYTLKIIREKNSNANLSSITVKNGDNNYGITSDDFNSSTLTYDIEVEEGVSSIDISATVEVPTTSYKLLDGNSIKVGINEKRILVVAEDGTTKTYKVRITRPANTNSKLNDIELSTGILDPTFDKDVLSYTVNVGNDVSSITVTGIKDNALSTVSGNGRYSLLVGTNEIKITVTSENGSQTEYVVNVIRAANSNAYLSSITVGTGILSPAFDRERFEYTVNVENNVNEMLVKASQEVSTTKINNHLGNMATLIHDLPSGNTDVEIITLAEDGSTLTYVVHIVKDKSENDNIENLLMEEGKLIPGFDPDIIIYDVYVPNEVTSGHFHVELEDDKASYVINGNSSFVVGNNEVVITVTSESGKTKDYKVNVIRQPKETVSNYLSNLTVSAGTLMPAFNKTKQYYEVTIPYETSVETVVATLEDNLSAMIGDGAYVVNVGKNLIIISVTNPEGIVRDYQIVVTRKENSDARLSSLAVSGSILSPSFDRDTYEYELTTYDKTLTFDTISTVYSGATYEIINNGPFVTGSNYDVIIRVTAADKETTKDYILHVTKASTKNNNLSLLSIDGFEINPSFVKTTTLYYLTVPTDVKNVNVIAIPEDSDATVDGNGLRELVVGENIITITVTSESGSNKAYTIVVTKEGSSNNYIKELTVDNGVFSPVFNKETLTYSMTVPYEETSLDMSIILDDESASYSVSGNTLNVGSNTVSIVVTAEDGSIRTYQINVTRETPISPLLENVKVKNYELTPTFNSYITTYNISVNNETTELEFTEIKKLDPNATYVINGNSSFVVGMNVVTIDVTSSNGIDTQTYTINVERQPVANNFLDYLYTDQGDFNEPFVKTTLEYSINVGYEVTEIELIGAPEDGSTTITGLGMHSLNTGENIIKVEVVTTSGAKRTYIIKVIRDKNHDNYLETLTVKNGTTTYTLSPEFNPYINTYNLSVGQDVMNVRVNATCSSTATLSGTGTKLLKSGNNEIVISVTAEDGTINNYTINIYKEPSDNNFLVDLIPSVGELDPAFAYDETEYTINLDSSASSLSFTVSLEDANAKVTGNAAQIIPDGTSTREIIVTAENGDERRYIITVVKERTDIATLKNLYVVGYPFEEVFDPDTLEYHISVPNSKKVLDPSEVVAQLTDPNGKIVKSSALNLSTIATNQFDVRVTAPDGFTVLTYKIFIERAKGSSSKISNLVPKKGYIEEVFSPYEYDYTWVVAKGTTKLNLSNLNITLEDPNATISADEIDITENPTFVITVTSEDGTSTDTYIIHVRLDLSAVATLEELSVDRGIMEPEFDVDTDTYDVYVYENEEELYVTATSSSVGASITGDGLVELDSDLVVHEVSITAEDGTVSIYTINIHRTVKIDEGLNNLNLKGLDLFEENCASDECLLSPSFSSDVIEYSIKVPNEYETLEIDYETMNDEQTVKVKINDKYVESYDLLVNKTVKAYVEVYDKFEKLTRTYIVNVTRSKSTNCNLDSLSVKYFNQEGEEIEAPLDKEFDKDVLEYTVEVPSYVDEVSIDAVLANASSGKTINGYNYLEIGNNIAEVYVVSASNTTKTYIINIVKGTVYDSYLRSITVATGVIIDLVPKFNKTTFEYTATIPYLYKKATVEAIPYNSTSVVDGTGEFELETGLNVITLTCTALDGSLNVYKVNLIKEISRDVNIRNITALEGELSPTFETGLSKYDIYVDETVDSLTLDIELSDSSSSYVVTGNANFVSGENIVYIVVQNEDKSVSKTYQLVVHKATSNNNYLSSLEVTKEVIDEFGNTNIEEIELFPSFEKDIIEYSALVSYDTDKVNVQVSLESMLASVTGTGEYYLDYGLNIINLVVTSESGMINNYQVNIYRNYNLNLDVLVSDIGSLDPAFDKDIIDYVIDVPNNENKIVFIALPESNKVSVEGSGTYFLHTGENTIEFTVKAPDDTERVYTVVVNREKSDNNYIKSLVVHEGKIIPDFDKDTLEYEMNVRNSVTSLEMDIELEDATASYEVLDNSFSGEGTHNVTIRVKAENGDTRDYIIKVNVQPDSYFSNRLISLTMTNGTFNPDFDPDITYYAATVPNSVTQTTISAILENIDATITGTGLKNLIEGRNVFYIDVTSQDGITNTYTVVIYRNPNNDATLNSLILKDQEGNGLSFSPIFNKMVNEYSVTVPNEVTSINPVYTTTDSNAVVTVNSPNLLPSGTSVISILVTAPDGITTLEYKINVTRTLSTNNYLKELSVSGYTIDPEFVKTNNGPYKLTVPNTVNTIYVNADAESSLATVSGDGSYSLSSGDNLINVSVTSESGDLRTYSLIVRKTADTDSSLKLLTVSDGKLTPSFDKDVTSYDVEVSDEVEEITVIGLATSAKAKISGNGTYTLDTNPKEIDIVVTAESGAKTTYKVNVKKVSKPSSKIKSLTIKEGELTPSFNKNTTSYSVMVPNEITELDLSNMVLEDPLATYEIKGNENFVTGNNKVEIEVTASDSSSVTAYVINVARQTYSSNYLKNLEVVGYTLTPSFDKTNLYYEVIVPAETTQVQIKASKEDSSSTLSGTGYKTLATDNDTYYIKVTSSSGSVRTYQVVIKRTKEEGNLLLTLNSDVGTIDPAFDSGTNSYTITVPEKTTSIDLTGTVSNGATVTGLGVSTVVCGTQTRNISVTSASGESNVYTISIVRPASTNTDIKSFVVTPDIGLTFDNDVLEYELDVADNISVVTFDVTPKDDDATIEGNGYKTLSYGVNEFEVVVTAEDGITTKTVKVKLNRFKEITDITVDPTELYLSVGEVGIVTYEVKPVDTSYTEFDWIIEDEEIASVNKESGVVTALKEGSTVLSIRNTHNNSVYKTVTINVFSKNLISELLTIEREKITGGSPYVIGIEPKTTIENFKKSFTNNESTIFVYDSKGDEITDSSKYVGSYMTVKLIVAGTEYDTLTVVVRGDINGDGIVTISDKTSVKNIILGKSEKTFFNVLISDLNLDGNVTVSDSTANKNFILGKTSSLN